MKFTLHTTRKISFSTFILGVCLLFSTQTAFSQGVLKTWDGGAGTNAWSDAANWDLDVLPANIDSVIIAAGQSVQVTSGTAVCRKLAIYGSVTVTAALTVDAATSPANTNNISAGHAAITLFGGTINNQGTMIVTGRQNMDAIRFDNPASGSANSTYTGAGSLTCNTTSAAGTGNPTGGNNGTIMTFAQTNGTATFTTSSSATYTFNLNTGGTKTAFYCPRGTAKIDGTGTITIGGAVRSIRIIPTAAGETPNLTIESGVTLNLSTTGLTASIGMILLDPGTLGTSVSMTNKGTLNFSGDVGHPIYMINTASAIATTNFTNTGTININGTFSTVTLTTATPPVVVLNNQGGIAMFGANTTLGNVFTNSGSINHNTTSSGTSPKPLFICSIAPKNLLTNTGTITVGTNNATLPIALRMGDQKMTVNNTGTITVGAGSITGGGSAGVNNVPFNNNAGGILNLNSGVSSTLIEYFNTGGTVNVNANQRVGRFTLNGGTIAIADGTTFTTFFLTLTSGNIPLGTGNIVMESGGSITGGSLASHIITNGTGTLTQTNTTLLIGMDKIYPVGQSASSYDPVTINHNAEANFSVRVGLQTTAGITGMLPVNREWDIAGTPGKTSLTFVTSALNKNGTNTRPAIGGSASGLVSHYNGSNWDANLTADYTTDTWFLTDYEGSFSPFVVGTPGVIPIELLSVTAKAVNNKNVVTWETATEINNKGFDVQRKNANGTWATLGFVKGENKPSTYTFEDKGPLSISYYRLRQMDFDGKETLSKVVSVSQNKKGQISMAPNPTSDKVSIFLSNGDRSEVTTVTVYDLIGRQVLTQKTTTNAVELDMSSLAKGTYLVRVDADNSIYTEKIIRQ